MAKHIAKGAKIYKGYVIEFKSSTLTFDPKGCFVITKEGSSVPDAVIRCEDHPSIQLNMSHAEMWVDGYLEGYRWGEHNGTLSGRDEAQYEMRKALGIRRL